MSTGLSSTDKLILAIVARTRGIRPETTQKFEGLKHLSVEALRKRMSRLAESGFLAVSKLPDGRQIYRLSSKGVRILGSVPSAWAASPSPAILAEMLSVSAFAWRSSEYHFLSKAELEALLREFPGSGEQPKTMGRFLLRRMKLKDATGKPLEEVHLHFWLAEPKPADELLRRTEVVTQKLSNSSVFSDLIASKVFGFSIAVPTKEAKLLLEARTFPTEAAIEVCEELQIISSK